ncbi:MAG: glycosyltransferase [Bacteroidetes bacterium]|nr:glycosyltransferase [Bacteroidota bacterium]
MKVLIAPLDWGLGHATRCISIINELLEADFEVIIASEGMQKQLLMQEFPALRFVELEGYGVKYAPKGWLFPLKIIVQIPKILIKINRESKWLLRFSEAENINIVISDNRFGLHSKRMFSVFITHQLYIESGMGNFFNYVLQKINYRSIKKFNACWVPDYKNENTLAGKLSHPKKIPSIGLRYIGTLSRFRKNEQAVIKNDLLILLSGPEPQRTILEKKIIEDLKTFTGNAVLLRGLPDEKENDLHTGNVKICNHLSSEKLNELICETDFIISRSGYTTIMEMVSLEKKMILIPTPGQTEQEYLAAFLMQKNIALVFDQKNFSLQDAFTSAKKFPYKKFSSEKNNLLKEAITSLKKSN